MRKNRGEITDYVAPCILIIFICAVVAAVVYARGSPTTRCNSSPDERIDDVVRVFMHQPDRYSFLIKNENSKELTLLSNLHHDKTRLVQDVPVGQDMFLELKDIRLDHYLDFSVKRCGLLIIHIHSATDINPAGWNHGKFGSGQTQVIE